MPLLSFRLAPMISTLFHWCYKRLFTNLHIMLHFGPLRFISKTRLKADHSAEMEHATLARDPPVTRESDVPWPRLLASVLKT